jgi:hypothetical protein
MRRPPIERKRIKEPTPATPTRVWAISESAFETASHPEKASTAIETHTMPSPI